MAKKPIKTPKKGTKKKEEKLPLMKLSAKEMNELMREPNRGNISDIDIQVDSQIISLGGGVMTVVLNMNRPGVVETLSEAIKKLPASDRDKLLMKLKNG